MRDEDRADLVVINARGLHVGRQIGGVRLPLPNAGARIHHDQLVADLQDDNGQRNRKEVRGQASLRQGGFRFLDRHALDEGGVMRLAPNAIVDCGDLDRAHLVFVVPDSRLDRHGGECRTGEDQRLAEAQSGGRRGG